MVLDRLERCLIDRMVHPKVIGVNNQYLRALRVPQPLGQCGRLRIQKSGTAQENQEKR